MMHLFAQTVDTNLTTQVGHSIHSSMTALWTKVAGFIPNFAGMLVILIVGYIISRLARIFRSAKTAALSKP